MNQATKKKLTSYLDDEVDFDVLACDPASKVHNCVDTGGAGALYCLCGEIRWGHDVPPDVKLYYYPATLIEVEEDVDA